LGGIVPDPGDKVQVHGITSSAALEQVGHPPEQSMHVPLNRLPAGQPKRVPVGSKRVPLGSISSLSPATSTTSSTRSTTSSTTSVIASTTPWSPCSALDSSWARF